MSSLNLELKIKSKNVIKFIFVDFVMKTIH